MTPVEESHDWGQEEQTQWAQYMYTPRLPVPHYQEHTFILQAVAEWREVLNCQGSMCILVDFASCVKPWSYFSLLSAVLATVDCLILSPFLLSFIDERKDEYDPLGPEGSLHSVGSGPGDFLPLYLTFI